MYSIQYEKEKKSRLAESTKYKWWKAAPTFTVYIRSVIKKFKSLKIKVAKHVLLPELVGIVPLYPGIRCVVMS